MIKERIIANRIFDLFRASKCKDGEIVPINTLRFSLIDKLNPKEREIFNIVFVGLQALDYMSYEQLGFECIRLTKKGYDLIYDEDLVNSFLEIPWVIPNKNNTDWNIAYNHLWRVIGSDAKKLTNLTGSQFYKIAAAVSETIDPSFKHYFDNRREKGLSTSKVDFFRDIIDSIQDTTERFNLYVRIQDNIEFNFLSKQQDKEEDEMLDPFSQIEQENAPTEEVMKDNSKQIYVSYSWANSAEMDIICNDLDANGISYKRDIKDCGYRQNIKNFEEEIGKGNIIIAIIDEKYMKSIHCMYEMSSMVENGYIEERLFPVFSLPQRDAKVYTGYLKYWTEQYKEKNELLSTVQAGGARAVIDELSYCDSIVMELPKFWAYINKHNTLTKEQLLKDDCAILIAELKNKLKALTLQ